MKSKILFLFIFLGAFLFLTNTVLASTTNGTIDSTFKYAKVCDNSSCTASSTINFLPTGATAVGINDANGTTANITGNSWGSTLGWINMAPTGYVASVNIASGAISGYAWSGTSGYINFAPTGYGVTINSSGEWNGYAWTGGTNGGWIKFACPGSNGDTCVKTDWRPTAGRTPAPSGGGGGGGGGGGSYVPAINSTTTNVVNLGTTVTQTGPQNQSTDYANNYRADINDSGTIDIFDYNLLMVNWNKTTTIAGTTKQDKCKTANAADLNCDGKVDLLDFNIVMIYWLQKLSPRQSTP